MVPTEAGTDEPDRGDIDRSGPVAGAGRCPGCGELTAPADQFCESCGRPLTGAAAGVAPGPAWGWAASAAPAGGAPAGAGVPLVAAVGEPPAGACRCGNGRPDADGYCDSCGALMVAAGQRAEFRAPAAALVTDRGRVHVRNEDAGVVAEAGGTTFAVVCDGVSTAPRPDVAARTAVEAAIQTLRRRLGGPAEPVADALGAATDAARSAVSGLANAAEQRPGGDAPACTFVAAVLAPDAVLHVAHVGDSRAYWVPDDGPPAQLTTDDSWAAGAIAAGLSPAEARLDIRAHTLTGWLGSRTDPSGGHLSSTPLPGPGLAVLCSDGLWNYLLDVDEFAAQVRQARQRSGADLLGCARELVDFACGCGGRDNITVAVLRHGPAAGPDGVGARTAVRGVPGADHRDAAGRPAHPDHPASQEGPSR